MLRAQVDPNVTNKHGETPLFAAVRGGHADVVAVLLLSRGDPSVQASNGTRADDYADGPLRALLALRQGLEVSAKDQYAAFHALEECTRFLMACLLVRLGTSIA